MNVNIPIVCGGALVNTGDIIFGYADGVVAIHPIEAHGLCYPIYPKRKAQLLAAMSPRTLAALMAVKYGYPQICFGFGARIKQRQEHEYLKTIWNKIMSNIVDYFAIQISLLRRKRHYPILASCGEK